MHALHWRMRLEKIVAPFGLVHVMPLPNMPTKSVSASPSPLLSFLDKLSLLCQY